MRLVKSNKISTNKCRVKFTNSKNVFSILDWLLLVAKKIKSLISPIISLHEVYLIIDRSKTTKCEIFEEFIKRSFPFPLTGWSLAGVKMCTLQYPRVSSLCRKCSQDHGQSLMNDDGSCGFKMLICSWNQCWNKIQIHGKPKTLYVWVWLPLSGHWCGWHEKCLPSSAIIAFPFLFFPAVPTEMYNCVLYWMHSQLGRTASANLHQI